jgi:hypothetical protein
MPSSKPAKGGATGTGCLVFFLVVIFLGLITLTVLFYNRPFGKYLGAADFFFFIFMVATIAYSRRDDKVVKLPTLNAPATLVEKVQEHRRYGSTNYLVFELEGGQRKMFRVTMDIYGKILEGEKKTLLYKEGGKIIEFVDFL